MNNNYALTMSHIDENLNQYYIVFSINQKQYAFNIKNVVEVINFQELEMPSKLPEGVIGLFNYNGTLINAIDISPFLGFKPSKFTINNQLIIVQVEDNYFAIHTESVVNITQLQSENIQTIPYEIENSILKEIYKSDNNLVNILDINVLYKLVIQNNSKINEINYLELLPIDDKSKEILKIRATQNKSIQNSFSFQFDLNKTKQYILFCLNEHNYYLDLKYVKEFFSIKRLNVTKLPYTEDFIKGMISLKGNFLVVVDLKRFLNNNITEIEEGSKLIIVEGKNFDIAFLVDEIKYIKNLKNIEKDKFFSSPSKYIYSEFMEEDELYSILNFEKIINDERLFINVQ